MMGIVDKLQRIRKTEHGFTIIEVMIVLAVTGVLFVSITATLQGKRQKTEFAQAINSIKAEIEQSISEVQTGYYPSSASFSCAGGVVSLSGAPTEQGANKSCIFLGKVLQFGKGYGVDPERYGVYTLTGQRDQATFAGSNPVIVNNESTQAIKPLQFGLSVVRMNVGGGGPAVGAVAFVPSFGQKGSLLYGSQADNDVVAVGTTLGNADKSVINGQLAPSYNARLNPPGGIEICFRDGYNENQSGLITIGGSGGTSTVSLSIKGTGNCT